MIGKRLLFAISPVGLRWGYKLFARMKRRFSTTIIQIKWRLDSLSSGGTKRVNGMESEARGKYERGRKREMRREVCHLVLHQCSLVAHPTPELFRSRSTQVWGEPGGLHYPHKSESNSTAFIINPTHPSSVKKRGSSLEPLTCNPPTAAPARI